VSASASASASAPDGGEDGEESLSARKAKKERRRLASLATPAAPPPPPPPPPSDLEERCLAAIQRRKARVLEDRLAALAFPRVSVEAAVRKFGADVEAAAGWLLEGGREWGGPSAPLLLDEIESSSLEQLAELAGGRVHALRAVADAAGDFDLAAVLIFDPSAPAPAPAPAPAHLPQPDPLPPPTPPAFSQQHFPPRRPPPPAAPPPPPPAALGGFASLLASSAGAPLFGVGGEGRREGGLGGFGGLPQQGLGLGLGLEPLSVAGFAQGGEGLWGRGRGTSRLGGWGGNVAADGGAAPSPAEDPMAALMRTLGGSSVLPKLF
jgi:hypothetical protein